MCINSFTDQPLDKVPADRTAAEQVLQQHSKTAHSLLSDFNINEAGKLVQKRRPAASILDEEMLLSEDEADNQPPAKKQAVDTETKEAKTSATNTNDKPQQVDKQNVNKPLKAQQQQQQQGGGNNLKRKRAMNRSPSNNRHNNNGPMNMNPLNQQMADSMPRDGNDLFMRKRNFMESDMGGGFDRPADRGFNMGGSNFMNERNMNNSNNFGNNRGDFGDEFSRRPAKNDNFNHFGGGNRSGGANNGAGAGGRMFNRF